MLLMIFWILVCGDQNDVDLFNSSKMSIPLNFCLLYTEELQFIMIFAFLATLAGLDSDEDISGKAAFLLLWTKKF